jgi:hypothetical protein
MQYSPYQSQMISHFHWNKNAREIFMKLAVSTNNGSPTSDYRYRRANRAGLSISPGNQE